MERTHYMSKSRKHTPIRRTSSLPHGVDGYYDHIQRCIWLREGLTWDRAHSVIEHEAVHAEEEHEPTMILPVFHSRELWVEREAARRLIPLGRLIEVLLVHSEAKAAAAALGVDCGIFYSRVFSLTDAEQEIFRLCSFSCFTNN